MAKYNSVSDELNAMINGEHNSEDSISEDMIENGAEFDELDDSGEEFYDDLDNDEQNDGSLEDTTTDTDNSGGDETNGIDGGQGDDTSTQNLDGSEENTQGIADDDNGENIDPNAQASGNDDDENNGNDDSNGASDGNPDDNSASGNESNTSEPVGSDANNANEDTSVNATGDDASEGISQEDAKKFKSFFDQVTSEFTANGKTVKGFSDPKKVIEAQQMLYGYNKKMSDIKKLKPFIAALKDNDLASSTDDFNLMIDAYKGNPEALKKVLSKHNIDPIEFNMEEDNYVQKNFIPSESILTVEDTIDTAKSLGVEKEFVKVISSEWDTDSFDKFTKSPQIREDLLSHMSTKVDPTDPNSKTVYETVSDRVSEMEMLDVRGTFGQLNSVDRYKTALVSLNEERQQNAQASEANTVEKTTTVKKEVDPRPSEVDTRSAAEIAEAEIAESEQKRTPPTRAEIDAAKQEILNRRNANKNQKQVVQKTTQGNRDAASEHGTEKNNSKSNKDSGEEVDSLSLNSEDFRAEFNKMMKR